MDRGRILGLLTLRTAANVATLAADRETDFRGQAAEVAEYKQAAEMGISV